MRRWQEEGDGVGGMWWRSEGPDERVRVIKDMPGWMVKETVLTRKIICCNITCGYKHIHIFETCVICCIDLFGLHFFWSSLKLKNV